MPSAHPLKISNKLQKLSHRRSRKKLKAKSPIERLCAAYTREKKLRLKSTPLFESIFFLLRYASHLQMASMHFKQTASYLHRIQEQRKRFILLNLIEWDAALYAS